MSSNSASPFTPEHIAEWASFGPKLKGAPKTDEERAAAVERKNQCTAMKQRLFEQFKESDPSGEWTVKKIEKELDRLVLEQPVSADSNSSLILLEPPSGTRDFYPSDMRLRNWLFGHWRATAAQFGFVEYDAPVLERVPLYERKAGEEIVQQMYAFTDQEGNRVTLRPEMTPSLARLVLQKTNVSTGECREPFPLKWFSIPQCWRFEATQRGRKREHYQWNMDIVGVEHVHAEVELLAAACTFFRNIGVGPDIVGIKINSRAVLESILAKHGITKQENAAEDKFAKACVIIDKLDKIGAPAVTEMLQAEGISTESCQEILIALQLKTIDELAAHVGGAASSPAIQDVQRLFALATDYGIADYLQFDASVVRGLAYYTGIVWEAFDRRGQLRAIMGGGRYDRLLELYGGPKCQIPCVGFGFGDCVIVELLKECSLLPEHLNTAAVDYVVCAYATDYYGAAARIAAQLRSAGATVDLMPTPKKKVANSFKHADVVGARRMVFVAPGELEKNAVRIKDLRTKDPVTGEGIQVDVPLDQLDRIDALIAVALEQATAAAAAGATAAAEPSTAAS